MTASIRRAATLVVILAAVPATAHTQCPDGTPPPCGRAGRGAPNQNSVAVLYFENLSRDSGDTYLADGLTEELTSRLGEVQRLRVTGRSAVRRAQQSAAGDFSALGRALGVRYVVEGSVRRAAQTVRVSVRLLRASDGFRVWGETYDRGITDILALEGEIAGQVVTNVVGRLLPGERTTLTARRTSDPAAYDYFLRGNYFTGRRSATAFRLAVEAFDLALQHDPGFAAAEARRAYVYALARTYGADWVPAESLAARAGRYAEHAIRLDSMSSDAWLAQAGVALIAQDLVRGRAAVARAVALDPRNPEAVHSLGVILAWLGADEPAIAQLQAALRLDPARAVDLLDLALVQQGRRRFDEALRLLDSAIAIDPELGRTHMARARVRLALGDVAGARHDAAEAVRLVSPGFRAEARAVAALTDAAAGDTVAANGRLAEIVGAAPGSWGHVLALLALGRDDSALTVLEGVHPELGLWNGLAMPAFDRVRASPRFQRVLAAWRPVGAVR